MGLIISRFKKKNDVESLLEDITKKINSLERNTEQNEKNERELVGFIVLYSLLLYALSSLFVFFYYFPSANWQNRLLYALPLIVFPFVLHLVKKFVHWFFRRRIIYNDTQLKNLKASRRKQIETIMDTQTYKKARDIIEKYDPSLINGQQSAATDDAENKTRPAAATSAAARDGPAAPTSTAPNTSVADKAPGMPNVPPNLRPLPLPRPILARETSLLESVMHYLVGDSVGQRYALVCAACRSHNGMALREEFEFIEFRCCYCYHLNPARKCKPTAPSALDAPADPRPPPDRTASPGQPRWRRLNAEHPSPTREPRKDL